jgi:hypothetical protein
LRTRSIEDIELQITRKQSGYADGRLLRTRVCYGEEQEPEGVAMEAVIGEGD